MATKVQQSAAEAVTKTYTALLKAEDDHTRAWNAFFKACTEARKVKLTIHCNDARRPRQAWCTIQSEVEVS